MNCNFENITGISEFRRNDAAELMKTVLRKQKLISMIHSTDPKYLDAVEVLNHFDTSYLTA